MNITYSELEKLRKNDRWVEFHPQINTPATKDFALSLEEPVLIGSIEDVDVYLVPEGLVGRMYGIEVAHQNNVGDTREHTDPPEDCWCWE